MILELTRPSEMGLAADLRRKLHEETLSDKNLWSQCLGQIRSFLSRPPCPVPCDLHRYLARFLHRYVAPMTSVERAASTTSSVISESWLILRMRSIWTNSRCSRRKLPPVMRAMDATA